MPTSKIRQVARDRQTLHEAFPQAVMAKGAVKRPLKIGIHSDILARMPDLTIARVRRALRDYVNGSKYLGQCVSGAWRIDLDGNPVSQIDEARAAADAARLANLHRVWRKKRACMLLAPHDKTSKDISA